MPLPENQGDNPEKDQELQNNQPHETLLLMIPRGDPPDDPDEKIKVDPGKDRP